MPDLDEIKTVVSELLAPLIEADGGTITVVSSDENSVVLKLGGSYGGCPGVPYAKSDVIEPLLQKRVPGDYTIEYQRG